MFIFMFFLSSSSSLQRYISGRPQHEIDMLISSKTGGATPLLIACRNGHYDIVQYLLKKCHADVEQSGSGECEWFCCLLVVVSPVYGSKIYLINLSSLTFTLTLGFFLLSYCSNLRWRDDRGRPAVMVCIGSWSHEYSQIISSSRCQS